MSNFVRNLEVLGLHELGGIIEGNYRNHHVRVYPGRDAERGEYTVYDVEFENRGGLMILIMKRSAYPSTISTGDTSFDRGFAVNGNAENDVKQILDPIIRFKIGYLKNIRDGRSVLEVGSPLSLRTRLKTYLSDRYVKGSNITRYTDFLSMKDTRSNLVNFRIIIDTIIDIVEKIEAHTPST